MDRPSSFIWHPKRIALVLSGFALIIIALAAVYAMLQHQSTTPVRINGTVYHVAVANTEAAREQGLSGVKGLDSNGGLLLQFASDYQWGIWMKDMNIPLDILWLDKDKDVVYIKQNVSPDLGTSVVMQPQTPSRYVLELSAGSVARSSLQVGQQATFNAMGAVQ